MRDWIRWSVVGAALLWTPGPGPSARAAIRVPKVYFIKLVEGVDQKHATFFISTLQDEIKGQMQDVTLEIASEPVQTIVQRGDEVIEMDIDAKGATESLSLVVRSKNHRDGISYSTSHSCFADMSPVACLSRPNAPPKCAIKLIEHHQGCHSEAKKCD